MSKFGTSGWKKVFEFDRTHVLNTLRGFLLEVMQFDRTQVLDALRGFLQEVMQLAVDKGYITLEEKEEFIRPAFAGSTDAAVLSK